MSINLSIPFNTLVDTVDKMSQNEKIKLSDILEEQIAKIEEDSFENDPKVKAEIFAAREDYKNGNYKTLNELKRN